MDNRDIKKTRMWEPHWKLLKENKFLMMDAPRDRHESIKYMIWKESKKDSSFLFRAANDGYRVVISHTSIGERLRLYLRLVPRIVRK